jgi:hypothetical protein
MASLGHPPTACDDAQEGGAAPMQEDDVHTGSRDAPTSSSGSGDADGVGCAVCAEALSLDIIVELVVAHLFSPRDILSASQTCSRFRSAVHRVEARRAAIRGGWVGRIVWKLHACIASLSFATVVEVACLQAEWPARPLLWPCTPECCKHTWPTICQANSPCVRVLCLCFFAAASAMRHSLH